MEEKSKAILTREFSLAEVLGVITGYLLVDRGFDRIHALIEWMAGGAIFTHQIPQVAPLCEASLKKQFPQLNTDEHQLLAWRIEKLVKAIRNKESASEALIWGGLVTQYGAQFQVAPLQPFDGDVPDGPFDGLDVKKAVILHVPSGDDFPDGIDA